MKAIKQDIGHTGMGFGCEMLIQLNLRQSPPFKAKTKRAKNGNIPNSLSGDPPCLGNGEPCGYVTLGCEFPACLGWEGVGFQDVQ